MGIELAGSKNAEKNDLVYLPFSTIEALKSFLKTVEFDVALYTTNIWFLGTEIFAFSYIPVILLIK